MNTAYARYLNKRLSTWDATKEEKKTVERFLDTLSDQRNDREPDIHEYGAAAGVHVAAYVDAGLAREATGTGGKAWTDQRLSTWADAIHEWLLSDEGGWDAIAALADDTTPPETRR